MASAKDGVETFDLTALERAWIKQAVGLQRQALVRSRQKEFVGGEVWLLRGKELDVLAALLQRF